VVVCADAVYVDAASESIRSQQRMQFPACLSSIFALPDGETRCDIKQAGGRREL